MTTNEKIELLKSREYQVVKSNDLILKTRYDFTVNEQKTLAYVCSMIKPVTALDRAKGSPFILDYEFDILDYIRILGLEDNGKLYTEIKTTLKTLADKSMWYTLKDGSETLVRWIDRVTTNKRSGKAKIRIDDRLAPLLFDLKGRYLSYGLKNILLMKSQYGIRMYELLKAYYDMKIGQTDQRTRAENGKELKSISWTIDLNELKKKLMVDMIKSYENYKDFRKYVLEMAQKEINALTDMNFYFEPILKGRKTVKIKFLITSKTTIDKYIVDMRNNKELGEVENFFIGK